MIRLLILLGLFALLIVCTAAADADLPGKNIALGKSVTFDPPPNDPGCTDPEDSKQLTDGLFAGSGFWVDKLAVGWTAASPFHMVIDLGSIQPISGVAFSTAARANADVLWPSALIVQVSDDGQDYHYVCDMTIRNETSPPDLTPVEKDFRYIYRVTDLKTHGRFVVISAVSKCPYVFCDEIEIYEGKPEYLKTNLPDKSYKSYRDYSLNSMHKLAVTDRMMLDVNLIKNRIDESALVPYKKDLLKQQLRQLSVKIDRLPAERPVNFKAILPLNDLEAQIFAINGSLLSKLGFKDLVLWKKHRYDKLDLFETPDKSKAEIKIAALQNEYRPDSFLITNASTTPAKVVMKTQGLPPGTEISVIPWTDTSLRIPVAAALPRAEFVNGKCTFDIPAGMTTKVWVGVDTSRLSAREYKGSISLSSPKLQAKVPVSIAVSSVSLNKPRLHLGVFDHTNGDGGRGMTPDNIPAAIKLMTSHYTDCPWTEPNGLPLKEQLTADSFKTFDEWVKRWPDAAHYMVFLNVPDNFGGASIGSKDFDDKVGAWAQAVNQHLVDTRVDPRKLTLLLVDEPRSDAQDQIITAWIKAIRASGARMSFFSDPIWANPREAKYQEAFTLPDIMSPNLAIYHRAGKDAWDYYESLRSSGRELWFYQCSGPVRNFDPTRYYRLLAWNAFNAKAKGINFWSFGDLGGRKSSWNEYETNLPAFAPAFIDQTTVTDSVHWQAVREGVQDYECMAMLQDAIIKTTDGNLKFFGNSLLTKGLEALLSDTSQEYNWKSGTLHFRVDEYRYRLIELLEKMQ